MEVAIPVIVNAQSGSADTRADPMQLHAAFRSRGLEADIVVASGEEIEAAVRRALATRPPLVVAGGGDGTVRSVAAQLCGSDAALGILPLGTLNHFARTLRIPMELEAAVGVIAGGHEAAVDVGEVDGWVFVNNASLGLYATIVRDRDRERSRLGLGKWPALAKATLDALRNPTTFRATLEFQGEDVVRRTPFLFVGNNRYATRGFRIGSRPRLDEGVLSVCVLRPKRGAGFLWLALRALFGGGGERDFEAIATTEFCVESEGSVELAFDGEVRCVDGPVRFRVRPRALHVRVPATTLGTR